MKRAFIIAPAAVAVVLGGALVAPSFVDWNKYKPDAIAQIKKATGYDVELNGDLGLTILPSPRVFMETVEIKAPAGSIEEHLIRVKRLDVNLAMGPLLTGKIDFSSVKLVEPDIALEVFEGGQQNWMTPELQAMQNKDTTQPAAEKKPLQIALRDVSIEKGRFIYRASKTAKPSEFTDVTVDLEADTLKGPFDIEGEITTGGQTITLDGKTGKLDDAAKSVQLNIDAGVKPLGIDVKFAGVAGTAEPYAFQGETEAKISDLAAKTKDSNMQLSGDAVLKGMVTGSKEKVDVKNATLDVAGNEFKGDLFVQLSPMKVVSSLTGAKAVNLDNIIKKSDQQKTSAGKQILPPTIELPAGLAADIAFALPGLTYNGQSYKNVTLKFAKTGDALSGAFAAGEIPGQGNIDVTGDLKFASKSVSKTGSEIFSDPTLTGTIKGQTQNVRQTAKALANFDNAGLDSFKTAAINGGFGISPDVFEMKSATLRLGDMNTTVSAAYSPRGQRPALALDLAADTLDFDALQQKFGGKPAGDAKPAGSLQSSLQNLSLPMDIDFDVGVQNATLNGQKITGLRAQGASRQNSLKFTNLSAQDFAGASLKLSGGVNDLKGLKGIDLTLNGESKDPRGFLKAMKVDASKLPESVTNAAVSAKASGDISKLGVQANIKALNGELIASGDVGDPLGSPQISKMSIQVKHQNLAEALRILAPGAPQYQSWKKPADFYADINTQGKVHNLTNIKANLAGASMTGNFSVDQSGAKPSLKGDLTFSDIHFVSDAAATDAVRSGGSVAAEKWSSAPINAQWMNAFNADINVKAKSITYETWVFTNPVLSFDLRDSALQIRQMEGGLYGGTAAINGKMISQAGKGPVSVDGTAKFNNVDIEQLTASLARGKRLIKGSGKTSMDIAVKGTGNSQQQLVSSLNGGGNINGSNIVLEGFDLAEFGLAMSAENKPGETLQGLAGSALKGGSTSFDTLTGNYTINQGIVNLNKLDLDGPTALLKTTGNVNLPAWTIATNHNITLKQHPDVPPFDIKVSGSLNNPGNTFAQGVLQDYFQRKLNRKLEKVLSDKLGGSKAGDALGAILGVQKPVAKAPTPAPVQPAAETAPAAGDEAVPAQQVAPEAQPVQPEATPEPAAQPEEKSKEQIQQEAIEGVLKGLIGQ